MDKRSFRFAAPPDLPAIERLLTEARLPLAGVAPHIEHFILAIGADAPVGVVGLEIHAESALLRSFAVSPARRGTGLGQALFDRALAHAHSLRLSDVFLLTTTAEGYFAKRGFQRCRRDEAPALIQASPEFTGVCPQSAVCMRFSLAGQAMPQYSKPCSS